MASVTNALLEPRRTPRDSDQQSTHLHVLNLFELAGVKIVKKFLLVYPGMYQDADKFSHSLLQSSPHPKEGVDG